MNKALPLTLAAAVLLVASLKLPLWQMRMEAPQYRDQEALRVAVYPGALRGDLNEIRVLNQYIGVHIPDRLPQLAWLPAALLAAGALGLLAAFLPVATRRGALIGIPALLTMALLAGAIQAQCQMYNIGHRRDAKTKLAGVKDFTAPLIGRAKIAQFNVASGIGPGAWLIGGALALQLAAAWLNRAGAKRPVPGAAVASAADGGVTGISRRDVQDRVEAGGTDPLPADDRAGLASRPPGARTARRAVPAAAVNRPETFSCP
jgi:hypothetical protein